MPKIPDWLWILAFPPLAGAICWLMIVQGLGAEPHWKYFGLGFSNTLLWAVLRPVFRNRQDATREHPAGKEGERKAT